MAFSPDGKYLASGSFDKCVHIWNTQVTPRFLGPVLAEGRAPTAFLGTRARSGSCGSWCLVRMSCLRRRRGGSPPCAGRAPAPGHLPCALWGLWVFSPRVPPSPVCSAPRQQTLPAHPRVGHAQVQRHSRAGAEVGGTGASPAPGVQEPAAGPRPALTSPAPHHVPWLPEQMKDTGERGSCRYVWAAEHRPVMGCPVLRTERRQDLIKCSHCRFLWPYLRTAETGTWRLEWTGTSRVQRTVLGSQLLVLLMEGRRWYGGSP